MARKALIIGGGVAGPATALFLRRAGWQPAIYEAAAEPDDYRGLFLNLATNGLAVLDELGLRDRLLTDVHRCPRMVMWSGRGKRLGEVPNGPAGQPERGSAVLRRNWLHQVLREAVLEREVPVHFGARLRDITTFGDGVRATFEDGRTAEADVLIGCDGVNSPTRTYIDPAAPAPAYTGLVGVGGFARTPRLTSTPDTQHFVFGRRSFFGYLAPRRWRDLLVRERHARRPVEVRVGGVLAHALQHVAALARAGADQRFRHATDHRGQADEYVHAGHGPGLGSDRAAAGDERDARHEDFEGGVDELQDDGVGGLGGEAHDADRRPGPQRDAHPGLPQASRSPPRAGSGGSINVRDRAVEPRRAAGGLLRRAERRLAASCRGTWRT